MEAKLSKKKKYKLAALAFCIVVFLLVLFVFSERTKEKGSFKVDEQEQDVNEQFPSDSPENFPLPDDSGIVDESIKEGEGRKGISLVITTGKSLDELKTFYNNMLKKENWTFETVGQEESFFTLSFEKENYSGFLGVTSEESGSIISVTIRIEENGL